jgi:hypothetical protein
VNEPRYSSPSAVQQAIKDAARRARQQDPTRSVNSLIDQEHFRRLLTRIFRADTEERWILKGGTAMLARISNARSTRDIDLLNLGADLDAAEEELIALAQHDLGDFFRFVHMRSHDQSVGDVQQYVQGRRVVFEVYIGSTRQGRVSIDLVTGVEPTGAVQVQEPSGSLTLPKLPSSAYRLFPLTDHLADKVCAIMSLYAGSESSREKDLVDLVIAAIAPDQGIYASELRESIRVETRRRQMSPMERLVAPQGWGKAYRRLARETVAKERYATIGQARELMTLFIDPVLSGEARGAWSSDRLSWGTTQDGLTTPQNR